MIIYLDLKLIHSNAREEDSDVRENSASNYGNDCTDNEQVVFPTVAKANSRTPMKTRCRRMVMTKPVADLFTPSTEKPQDGKDNR